MGAFSRWTLIQGWAHNQLISNGSSKGISLQCHSCDCVCVGGMYVWEGSCPISFKKYYLKKCYWNFEQPEGEILAMRVTCTWVNYALRHNLWKIPYHIRTFGIISAMNFCPPNPGSTVMISTISTRLTNGSTDSTGVFGFTPTPTFIPAFFICWISSRGLSDWSKNNELKS